MGDAPQADPLPNSIAAARSASDAVRTMVFPLAMKPGNVKRSFLEPATQTWKGWSFATFPERGTSERPGESPEPEVGRAGEIAGTFWTNANCNVKVSECKRIFTISHKREKLFLFSTSALISHNTNPPQLAALQPISAKCRRTLEKSLPDCYPN